MVYSHHHSLIGSPIFHPDRPITLHSLDNRPSTMKLLSWMHRKLQRDDTESVKRSSNGIPCFSMKATHNNREDYLELCNGPRGRRELERESITGGLQTPTHAEMFPGFLTIGMLGVEPISMELKPPILALSSEETHEEMMRDGKEEKLFQDEDVNKGSEEPSRRHIQAGNFKLSIGEKEVEADRYVKVKSSSSKGCHFVSSLIMEEKGSDVNLDRSQMQGMKKNRSPMHDVSKMLQTLQASSKNFTSSTKEASPVFPPNTTKFFKIQQLFHKKVHPQMLTTAKECKNFGTSDTKKAHSNDNNNNRHSIPQRESSRRFCHRDTMNSANKYPNNDPTLWQNDITRTDSKLTTKGINLSSSGRSAERWIRTDAEYLVLELQ